MSAVVLPAPPPLSLAGPRPFHWTCDLFHTVCDTGVLEGRNVILVNGELLEMPPPNPPHNTSLTLAAEALGPLFRPGFVLRNQMALDVQQDIDPVPDLAFVAGSARDYTNRQPTTAVLVVEVADSTLSYDTTTKAELYATAGIAEYWGSTCRTASSTSSATRSRCRPASAPTAHTGRSARRRPSPRSPFRTVP